MGWSQPGTLEVAGFELGVPHDLVDAAQVADAELVRPETGGDGGVLEPVPQRLERVDDDATVVEGERDPAVDHVVDPDQVGVRRVGAGLGVGQVGHDRPPRHGDHPHAGVAVGCAIGAELGEVAGPGVDAGLLGELAPGRVLEVFVDVDEPARQRPGPLERGTAPLHQHELEPVVADGEDHQVDGDRERREGTRVVVLEVRHDRTLPVRIRLTRIRPA